MSAALIYLIQQVAVYGWALDISSMDVYAVQDGNILQDELSKHHPFG